MSYRTIGPEDDELKQMLRKFEQRISALEGGGAIRGQVSFDSAIQIGDVLVTILDGVGTHRTVQFKNLLSGATSTIVL